jgi:hypothetical protein
LEFCSSDDKHPQRCTCSGGADAQPEVECAANPTTTADVTLPPPGTATVMTVSAAPHRHTSSLLASFVLLLSIGLVVIA